MPLRLEGALKVAIPQVAPGQAPVIALPTPVPLRLNVIVLPGNGVPSARVKKAVRGAVVDPPTVPLAGLTVRLVAVTLTVVVAEEVLLVSFTSFSALNIVAE